MASPRSLRGPRGADRPRCRLSRERSARDACVDLPSIAAARPARYRRAREGHRRRAGGAHRRPAQPSAHRADRFVRTDPPRDPRTRHAHAPQASLRGADDRAVPAAVKQTLERTTLGTGALVWAGFDGPEAPGPILDAVKSGRIGGILLFAFRGNIKSK